MPALSLQGETLAGTPRVLATKLTHRIGSTEKPECILTSPSWRAQREADVAAPGCRVGQKSLDVPVIVPMAAGALMLGSQQGCRCPPFLAGLAIKPCCFKCPLLGLGVGRGFQLINGYL